MSGFESKIANWPDHIRKEYIEAGLWTDETFSGCILDRARLNPSKVAIVDGEKKKTYSDLVRDAQVLASYMLDNNIKKGEVVIIQLPNCYNFIALTYGCFMLGVIPLFVLPGHRDKEIHDFVMQTGARFYFGYKAWAGFSYENMITGVMLKTGNKIKSIFIDDINYHDNERKGEFFFGDQVGAIASDTLLLQMSGGTTGIPKLIPRRHYDYLYSVRRSCEICKFGPDTVYMAVLPLGHNFTMSSPGFLGVLYGGGTVVVADNVSPTHAFDIINSHGVTDIALVPPLAQLWAHSAKQVWRDFPSLRLLQVGGAKASSMLMKELINVFGCAAQQVFGMAEGLVCYTNPSDPIELVLNGHVKPMSDADEVLVLDSEGEQVESGLVGELFTRGPYTIRGYLGNRSAESFTSDGFYRTGDLVKKLPGGRLEVVGRCKDQINKAGEKIAPDEIEQIIYDTGLVSDVLLVGIPDDISGVRLVAAIIKNERTDLRLIKDDLKSQVAAFKQPDEYVMFSSFPLTAAGKNNRREMRVLMERFITRKIEGNERDS